MTPLAPVLAVVVFQTIRSKEVKIKDVLVGLALWLVGSLPYSGLVVLAAIGRGDIYGTLYEALFGVRFAEEVLNATLSFRMTLISLCFVLLNFPNLLLPAAVYGVARARRLGVAALARRALLAEMMIHVCFVIRFDIVDQHTFFLPTYVLLTIFGGTGFAALQRGVSTRRRRVVWRIAVAALALTPVWYVFVPAAARRAGVLDYVARNKPYRDDYTYVFTPWSIAERSADTMSREAVELAGARGLIIVEDPLAVFAIRYRALREQTEGLQITRFPTPQVIQEVLDEGGSVVLVPMRVGEPAAPPAVGSWQQVGDLYLLALPSSDE